MNRYKKYLVEQITWDDGTTEPANPFEDRNKKPDEEKKTEEKKQEQPKPRCPSGQRYCWGECLDSTGFKNEEEGNKFREWVNSKYSDYAKEIQLDPAGKFNNCYIRKAWKKYGEEYKNQSGEKKDNVKKDEPAVKKNPYLNRKPEAGTESD